MYSFGTPWISYIYPVLPISADDDIVPDNRIELLIPEMPRNANAVNGGYVPATTNPKFPLLTLEEKVGDVRNGDGIVIARYTVVASYTTPKNGKNPYAGLIYFQQYR